MAVNVQVQPHPVMFASVFMHGCSVDLFTMYTLTYLWLKTRCVTRLERALACTWSNGVLFVVFILNWLISRTIGYQPFARSLLRLHIPSAISA